MTMYHGIRTTQRTLAGWLIDISEIYLTREAARGAEKKPRETNESSGLSGDAFETLNASERAAGICKHGQERERREL